jgi:hypothetical protein
MRSFIWVAAVAGGAVGALKSQLRTRVIKAGPFLPASPSFLLRSYWQYNYNQAPFHS